MFKVTPWEVSGKVDYDKLVDEFGVSKIDPIYQEFKEVIGDHPLVRRRFFYAHRDLDLVLKDLQAGNRIFLYTGRGPSNKMHLGHLIPFIFAKWLQEQTKANLYIQITDDEKFLVKDKKLEEIDEFAVDNIKHIAALGFDKRRTFIFRDTEYIAHMYRLALKIAKKVNFSVAKAVFGFTSSTNIGWIFFPALQMVPTFFEEHRCLIPCAIDQDPYWRIQRDIAHNFGYKTATILSKFLPGLAKEEKMSSSKPETAIMLDDDYEAIQSKITRKAFTGGRESLTLQRKLGGNPDICNVFAWYSLLFEPDDKALQERYEACRSGKLTCGECKRELIERMWKFLEAHQRRVEKVDVDIYMYDGKLAKKMWETFY